jgi:beta-lactamase regulating signal transducer with metallopeptidase domain
VFILCYLFGFGVVASLGGLFVVYYLWFMVPAAGLAALSADCMGDLFVVYYLWFIVPGAGLAALSADGLGDLFVVYYLWFMVPAAGLPCLLLVVVMIYFKRRDYDFLLLIPNTQPIFPTCYPSTLSIC